MNKSDTPNEVPSSEGLGLPPLPRCYMRHWINCPFEDIELFKEEQMRAYAEQAVAAERDPANVVFRALLLAAWDAPGTRTAGEMRAAAVTLFGEAAVDAALERIRA